MKTFSLATATLLIVAAGTATAAEPATAAVTIVAAATAGTDIGTAAPSTTEQKVAAPAAVAPEAFRPTATAKSDDNKAAPQPAAPAKPAVRAVKFRDGEGSVWKASSHGYQFSGSYRGCQYRGYVNATGYHVDKSC